MLPRRPFSPFSPFSDESQVLFESDDPITALSLAPAASGTLAYGTSRGLVGVWPSSSFFSLPHQGERLSGEVLSLSWAMPSSVSGRTPSISLVAGDSAGFISLRYETCWRTFRAFETGIETTTLSSSTLVAASEDTVKVWALINGESETYRQPALLYHFTTIGAYRIQCVRLVLLHQHGEDDFESFTVVDVNSQIFRLDAISGAVRGQHQLGHRPGHRQPLAGSVRFYYDSKDWGNSHCIFGIPSEGYCLHSPIHTPDAFHFIAAPQPEPASPPLVALHPGGLILGTAPDQSVRVWDIHGAESPVMIQSLRVPRSTIAHHVGILEYGRVGRKDGLVTVAQTEHQRWAVVLWEDLQQATNPMFTRPLWGLDLRRPDRVLQFLFGIMFAFLLKMALDFSKNLQLTERADEVHLG